MVDPAIFAGREEAIDARNAGSDGEVLRRRQELQGECEMGYQAQRPHVGIQWLTEYASNQYEGLQMGICSTGLLLVFFSPNFLCGLAFPVFI